MRSSREIRRHLASRTCRRWRARRPAPTISTKEASEDAGAPRPPPSNYVNQVCCTSPSVFMALGAEAEAGFKGSPWSLGTVARTETYWSELTPFTFLGSPNFSTWIRYTTARADNLSFSLFLGASQQISGPLVSPIPEDPARNAAHSNVLLPVVGVTYRQQWGWFWTRVSPNAVLGLDPSYYTTYLGWTYPVLMASGIPWLECGVSVLPGLSLSAALSTNLLRATWEF